MSHTIKEKQSLVLRAKPYTPVLLFSNGDSPR